jgi:alpha-beta hydrolase superfamily lysophospholipase
VQLITTNRTLRHEYPKIPIFIWGHGIGAVFAIRVAVEHPNHADGLLLESPFINPSETTIGWHKTFGGLFQIEDINICKITVLAQILSFVVPDLKISVTDPSFYTSGFL